jgi:hypothetical protein
MAALVLFAQEKDWEGALNKFIRTRTVYQELAQLGDMEEQVNIRSIFTRIYGLRFRKKHLPRRETGAT